ncbi:hypothetical protein GCM10023067_24250 [Aminobacter aganoensis]
MPYTSAQIGALQLNNLTSGVGDTMLTASMGAAGGTGLQIYKLSAGAVTALTHADITNTSVIPVMGFYFV